MRSCGRSGGCLAGDGFSPFPDSLERAAKSGVSYVAELGGSVRNKEIVKTENRLGMRMAFTNKGLFYY